MANTHYKRRGSEKQFGELGIRLMGEKTSAQRVVTLKLIRFWAEEAPGYHSVVRVNAEVKDASGKVLWRGSLFGENKRFGRSLKTENYRETLTDATQRMINKLFGDAGFQKALNKE